MTKVITLDANILIYALDRQAGQKHLCAITIIEKALSMECVLTLQSLAEFYFAATRKGKLDTKVALQQIKDWQDLFPVASAKPDNLNYAILLSQEHSFAFWDAMLLATARSAGVTLLLSEDFQHQREIDGVLCINPFIDDSYL